MIRWFDIEFNAFRLTLTENGQFSLRKLTERVKRVTYFEWQANPDGWAKFLKGTLDYADLSSAIYQTDKVPFKRFTFKSILIQ